MKNQTHLSTGLPLLDGLIAFLRRFKFLMWFGGSESSWVQSSTDKDSVDLESGKGCLMPPHRVKAFCYNLKRNFPTQKMCSNFRLYFFNFSKKILVSEEEKRGRGNHVSWSYSTFYYFVGLPYHRSGNWNLSARQEDAGQKLRGISIVRVKVKDFCILVEICQIRLHSGLKNPYSLLFL